ncbi:MAG: class I SAM-dependent methyltransferase [Candidatus Sericytochromatia bacterium]|nr:class I SAM-dependent methyltransferase [Candidatus Sericytochromatia bacterium]
MIACTLCAGDSVPFFAEVKGRHYYECATCHLVLMAPDERLGADDERQRYETHENDPADLRYRAYLQQVSDPLMAVLAPGARGLDFGSGPGPTLWLMFEEQGYPMAIYDPFFAPDTGVLDETYDFITCTEAAEHFYDPAAEFARFDRLLTPGGWLGIMTTLREQDRPFDTWQYVRDLTHVCFYEARTMKWIAERHRWALSVPSKNVAIFRKALP